MPVSTIGYLLVLGKPLVFWIGIMVFASLIATASIGFLNHKGIRTIPFKWHPRLAAFAIALAALHGTLAILAYI